jgi:hypothetical protein
MSIIDIFVDEGFENSPYFYFYLDSNGTTILEKNDLDIRKTYRFQRLNKLNTEHPFYMSDVGVSLETSGNILITGDGEYDRGIIEYQTFILTFLNTNTDYVLYYYSTSDTQLSNTFELFDSTLITPPITIPEVNTPLPPPDYVGSISIVFDENRLCTDNIEFDDNPLLDPTETDILTDPNSSRTALQQLRILKTRETGNEQVIPNILGRYQGRNIDFRFNTYEDYQMRRKLHVLKNYNKKQESKKTNYSYFANSGKSKYKHMTNKRINQLIQSQKCTNANILVKPATNSGVFGDNTPLYLDPNVKYHVNI